MSRWFTATSSASLRYLRSDALGAFSGAFAFALTLAYLPGALGAVESGRWALIAAGAPLLLLFSRKTAFTLGDLLGLLFLGWAALSLSWAASLYDGARQLAEFAILAGVFRIGAALPSLRPVYIGLGVGFAINGLVALAQHYGGWQGVVQMDPPAGLFSRAKYLAEPAALVLIGLLGHRRWWLALALLPCVTLASGRGALVGLGAALVLWLWPYSRWLAAGLVAAGVLACASMIGAENVTDRLQIWTDTVAGLTPLGRGIGGFFVSFPSHAPSQDFLFERADHAHNDVLELAYELGPVGVLLFLALLCVSLCSPRRTERAVLLAFTMEAAFAFPLHLPVTAFCAAVAAGHLCGARVGVRDELARWRMAIRGRAQSFGLGGRGGSASAPRPSGVSA